MVIGNLKEGNLNNGFENVSEQNCKTKFDR